MTKEDFLKELNKNLKWLTKKERKEELIYYENLDNYNIDPIKVANEIYQKRNLKITINKKIKFLDAVNIIINNLQSKDKNKLKKILLFFLSMFLFIIIIKVPFIYVRDMITTLFMDTFKNDHIYILWALTTELAYALTSILIFIKAIKNKALELKKEDTK